MFLLRQIYKRLLVAVSTSPRLDAYSGSWRETTAPLLSPRLPPTPPQITSPLSLLRTFVKRFGKRAIDFPEETVPTISTTDWVKSLSNDPKRDAVDYFFALFPILGWIQRYNLGWLSGDVIAGLTVGIVLVPQSMSYAQIATLPSEYGLYSSFVGVFVYCFFATSKDVSIGPVAVMSLTVAQIIKDVNEQYPERWESPEIATTIAFLCGFIVLGIGLLRLGWLVEFIPAPAVSGFMTGSAINIVAGQVPGLMGITGFNTRATTYEVIINTLKGLPRTQLDAAFGLSGLLSLYIIRTVCDRLAKRYPRRERFFFFMNVFRNAFVVIILTIAAWLFTRHRKSDSGKYPIKILETVPRGLKHVGKPTIDPLLIKTVAPDLPVATIILLLEHIAIAKSFGRVNGYTIDPNTELVAIGVTNTLGSLFNAYPATGSFSRSALNSKSGVRTPAGGLMTSVVVIVAIYGLTPAFYWIPTAGLSAVIIHAVADLVAMPSHVYSFWRVSPLEFIIWAAAVLVTIFSTIEDGIYTAITASLALLLIRIAHPRGSFLGRVTVYPDSESSHGSREVYLPLPEGADVDNHLVKVSPPPPGVIIYRFEESYVYPNCALANSALVSYIKANTRRGKDMSKVKASDRPWNDPGPGQDGADAYYLANQRKPSLHAIVLDFSAVSNIDTTAVQALMDTRTEVERWADHPVEFHFATVLSPWIRRALVAGQFGVGSLTSESSIPSDPSDIESRDEMKPKGSRTPSISASSSSADLEAVSKSSIITSETPFIHCDLAGAVRAAEHNLRGDSNF